VIGSHTRNHLYLKGAQWGRETNVELLYELLASRREIERNLGVIPQYFAYPGGLWSPLAEKLVARVYRSARSWIWRGKYPYCDRHTNPYRLPGMNISFHLSFEDFKKLVNYTEPSYQYQWDNNWIGGEKGLVGRLASRLRR
jgi:hypothetical protein